MSDTSLRDQRSHQFKPPKARARVAVAGELLFEFLCGQDRFRCQLRDHGEFGIEAQFYENEESLFC